MPSMPPSDQVVVVLPYVGDRVLLQLRDHKRDIRYPGQWGFFGGSIETGELPEDAAVREIVEEIGYRPLQMIRFSSDIIPDHGGLLSHAFGCLLTAPLESLDLKEGLDFGLFSIDDILSKQLFSGRMNELYPVIDNPFLPATVRKLWDHLGRSKNDPVLRMLPRDKMREQGENGGAW